MNAPHPRRVLVLLAGALVAAGLVAGCASGGSTTSSSTPTTAVPPASSGVVRVSQDQFTAHAEPHVAANPRDPRNLLAASMVYRGTARGLATYASFDSGATWQSNGPLPGAAPNNDADVTVTFDQAGHGYVAGVVSTTAQLGTAYVWRTDDGGRLFQPPVAAVRGEVDHPGMAADPTAGSTDLYLAGIVFEGSTSSLRFTRSTDGGHSFEPSRAIDPTNGSDDRLTVVAAGPGGLVAVMYFAEPPDGSVNVMVATSTDHGSTFASHVRLSTVHWPPAIPGVNPRSGPAIAIDPTTGDMYAAVATSGSDAQASEVDVFTSHDSGRSWSPPVPAVHAVGVTYLQPQLAVDDNGRLGLEAFGLANGRVNLILLSSSSRAATFGPLRTVTEGGGFDPTLGLANSESASAQHWFGDYQGLTTAGGAFHPVWNDTSPGHLELFTAAIPAAPSG